MENNWFKKAGSLDDEPIKNNETFLRKAEDLDSTPKLRGDLASKIRTSSEGLKPAGDLDDKELNSKPSVTMTAAELEKKLFGRVLDKTQKGYEDALARKEAAWKEYEEIDSRISNGTATEEDWERHDEVVERYRREARVLQTIKSYLENNPNMVDKKEVKPSSVGFKAGDLETPKQNNSFKFDKKEETIQTPEEIRAWLKTIVSGVKKSTYEFGRGHQDFSSARILVGLDKLKEMVENGDNIIKAEYLENMNMVDIEFESFRVPNKSR